MNPGDSVTYWANYRGDGRVGGWVRHTFIGTVLKVNDKTVRVLRQGWVHAELVPRERILTVRAP